MLLVQSAAVDTPEHGGSGIPQRDSLLVKESRISCRHHRILCGFTFSLKEHFLHLWEAERDQKRTGVSADFWHLDPRGSFTKEMEGITQCLGDNKDKKRVDPDLVSKKNFQHPRNSWPAPEGPSRRMSKHCHPKILWAQCPVPKRKGRDD